MHAFKQVCNSMRTTEKRSHCNLLGTWWPANPAFFVSKGQQIEGVAVAVVVCKACAMLVVSPAGTEYYTCSKCKLVAQMDKKFGGL